MTIPQIISSTLLLMGICIISHLGYKNQAALYIPMQCIFMHLCRIYTYACTCLYAYIEI